MRASILAVTAAGLLAIASTAIAAPTCHDIGGETVRCGTPGAMPVGWRPLGGGPAASHGAPPSLNLVVSLACVVGGFFALIALMPDFDGRWDEQEGGDEPE